MNENDRIPSTLRYVRCVIEWWFHLKVNHSFAGKIEPGYPYSISREARGSASTYPHEHLVNCFQNWNILTTKCKIFVNEREREMKKERWPRLLKCGASWPGEKVWENLQRCLKFVVRGINGKTSVEKGWVRGTDETTTKHLLAEDTEEKEDGLPLSHSQASTKLSGFSTLPEPKKVGTTKELEGAILDPSSW